MWLITDQLRQLGFRPVGRGYWWCDRGHGLPPHAHLSLFPWGVKPTGRCGPPPVLEVNAFHVTFEHRGNNLHFYYHECGDRAWRRGGHTHRVQLAALGADRRKLRRTADAVAERFAVALGGTLVDRGR